jgi:hypothetical protein
MWNRGVNPGLFLRAFNESQGRGLGKRNSG